MELIGAILVVVVVAGMLFLARELLVIFIEVLRESAIAKETKNDREDK